MKWILCVLLVGGAAAAGWMKARHFENRVAHLRDLQKALRALEAEMKYRRAPMPELFARLGEQTEGLAAVFFTGVGSRLKEGAQFDFSGLWTAQAEGAYEGSSLKEEDLRILRDMGMELGKTDIDNQEGLFREAFYRLGEAEKEAAEEKRTKGRMYKGLGVAAGAAAVVMLL
ncbi:MAG: stage III sporulation protein AB [Bacillota bacterium]|nr:stage III sporulation protein AB [Bacillota bacterium]